MTESNELDRVTVRPTNDSLEQEVRSSGRQSRSRPGRRVGGWLAVGALALAVGAGGGWAVATVFSPPEDVLDETAYTFVEVIQGEVGSSISLNTVVAWSPAPIGANQAPGVVTSVNVSPGQEVGAGAVLYSVNLRPVVIAQGNVPAFRSMSSGTTGTDVAQLQSFLAAIGLYAGDVDGSFGSGTSRAVEGWQESLGLESDGVVQAGDIIFVPSLPTRVTLDTDLVSRGASLGGGEQVLSGLPSTPGFDLPVTDAQSALIPSGTRVEITGPAGELWESTVVDRDVDSDGAITLRLEGVDGGTICGDACADIAVGTETLLLSKVITVEPASGAVVPSAAILTDAAGNTAVIDEEGVVHSVTIVSSARGMSVIEGVDIGVSVRVPASGAG